MKQGSGVSAELYDAQTRRLVALAVLALSVVGVVVGAWRPEMEGLIRLWFPCAVVPALSALVVQARR